jgi:hypothetical protein
MRQAIALAIRPAVFDRDVTALDIASFAQALAERLGAFNELTGRRAAQDTDHWHCLLRVRTEWQHDRRTTKKANKFAPPHLARPKRGAS